MITLINNARMSEIKINPLMQVQVKSLSRIESINIRTKIAINARNTKTSRIIVNIATMLITVLLFLYLLFQPVQYPLSRFAFYLPYPPGGNPC